MRPAADLARSSSAAALLQSRCRFLRIIVMIAMCIGAGEADAEAWPSKGVLDGRIRTAIYSADQVYSLRGYAGYQIDLQFQVGEYFTGLGAGDLKALSFRAQDNHLFLKPSVAQVRTNLTILTNRRHYQFDYGASAHQPDPAIEEVIYALRFVYPATGPQHSSAASDDGSAGQAPRELDQGELDQEVDARLARGSAGPLNLDYWYCGHPALRPEAASDDGIHTRLRFGARSEQPAIFVRNDDGTESLLNFHMDVNDVVVHRIARRLIVRRGKLAGCIVNRSFGGSGSRLQSGTVAGEVDRRTRSARP